MLQALFYKEWIKTRRIVVLISIILIGLICYTFIYTGQLFRVGGAVQTWNTVILKDMPILPDITQWIPLMVAFLLSFFQFVPEITDRRLKLTLHLPLSETRTISILLLYGIIILLVAFLFTYLVLSVGLSLYYPREIITAMLWKSTPWFLAGILGYILSAWVCIEPVWHQRIYNSAIGLCILSFFFIDAKSGAYIPFISYLVVAVAISFSFPFYSTARFKDGAQ